MPGGARRTERAPSIRHPIAVCNRRISPRQTSVSAQELFQSWNNLHEEIARVPAQYALNNFNKAVRILNDNGLGKREWLSGICIMHLCQLELSDIPDALRRKFMRMRAMLKFDRANRNNNALRDAINAMSDDEVDEICALILTMREEIAQSAH